MSLRANPPKKELFEQDVYRPAKRLKSVHSPHLSPQAPVSRYHDIFPKLNVKQTGPINSLYQSHSSSLPQESSAAMEKCESPLCVDILNLREIPADSGRQVTWIAEAIRTLARKLPPADDAIPIILSSPNSCDIVCGPGFRPTGFTGFSEPALHIKRRNLVNGRLDHAFPPTMLDTSLEDRIFARHHGDSDVERRRAIWGGQLIYAICQGSYEYGQSNADEMRATVLGSQNPHSFLAALETLANQTDVVNMIDLSLNHLNSPSSNPGASNPYQIPSSIIDGDNSSLSTPTETLRSQSTEATSATSIASLHEGPYNLSETRLLNGLNSGISLCRNAEVSNFQAIVDRARQSATADALALRHGPKVGVHTVQRSTDPIVNTIYRACAALHEMAIGRPVLYRPLVQDSNAKLYPNQFLSSGSGSSLYKPSQDRKVGVRAPNAVQRNEAEQRGTSNAQILPKEAKKGDSSESREGLLSSSEFSVVHETVEKHSGRPVPETKLVEDDETITEAQIDGILALANGGNLEAQDSDSETEADLSFDSERTISRPLTPETIVDKNIISLLDGIVSELTTNSDHGHGLAFQYPHISYYQSAHYQRFASDLRSCVTEASPKVNVIMSAEQANATRELYKHLQRRVTRPNDQPLHPSFSPAWPQISDPMPHIQPPPGFEIRWHTPYVPPAMGVVPHAITSAPGLVPSVTVLPSDPPPLPRLAPKPKRTSNQLGEAFGLPPFPSDPAAEARARLKKRILEFQSDSAVESRARQKKRVQKPRQKKAWTFATPRLPVKKTAIDGSQ